MAPTLPSDGALHALALARELRENRDDPAVELGARAAAQLGQRLVRGQRLLVGAARAHRVVRVAHRDDPGGQWYLVAEAPVGVAAAVDALVRGAHDRGDVGEGRRRLDDALADDGVTLHERPLRGVERAGLLEDRVRDRDLADV